MKQSHGLMFFVLYSIFLCFSKKTAIIVTGVIWTSAKQDYAEFMSGVDLGGGKAWTSVSFHRLRRPVSCVCAKCHIG